MVSVPLHVVHTDVATSLGASKASPCRGDGFTGFEHQGPLVILEEFLVELLYYSRLLVGDAEPLEVDKGPSQSVYFLPTMHESPLSRPQHHPPQPKSNNNIVLL